MHSSDHIDQHSFPVRALFSSKDSGVNIKPGTGGLNSRSRNLLTFTFSSLLILFTSASRLDCSFSKSFLAASELHLTRLPPTDIHHFLSSGLWWVMLLRASRFSFRRPSRNTTVRRSAKISPPNLSTSTKYFSVFLKSSIAESRNHSRMFWQFEPACT